MKKLKSAFALVAVSAVAASAQAAGPDMSGLTGAVDFTTVTAAILAIAGLLAVVHVAMKGSSLGIKMLQK